LAAKNETQKTTDRLNEICVAAAQIFAEKGFDSTSLNEIADALDITKAALYYYVESKQDLLFKIINLGLDSVDREVLIPAREIVDAETRLRFVITNHARLSAGGNHAVIIVSHEVSVLNFDQREKVVNRRRDYFDFVRDTLVQLKRENKLSEIDITTATFTIFGMILWLSRWFKADGKISIEKVCQDVCEMALRGINCNPDHPQNPSP
jgi:AcrR family transcriptional regulator